MRGMHSNSTDSGLALFIRSTYCARYFWCAVKKVCVSPLCSAGRARGANSWRAYTPLSIDLLCIHLLFSQTERFHSAPLQLSRRLPRRESGTRPDVSRLSRRFPPSSRAVKINSFKLQAFTLDKKTKLRTTDPLPLSSFHSDDALHICNVLFSQQGAGGLLTAGN